MFPIIVRSRHFPFRPYAGITLFLFVVFRKDCRVTASAMRHEMIHFRQQVEWLVVGFIFLYYGEMLYYWLRYRNVYAAYRHISFEREAYAHEHDATYLKRRKLWANYRIHSK